LSSPSGPAVMDDTEDLLIELLTRLVIAVEEIADAIQEAANDEPEA